MKIRIADKDDTSIIFSCIKGLADYVGDTSLFTATEHSIANIVFAPNSNCIVFIAEEDQIPKGFALCFKTVSTFTASYNLYIEDLFVYPEYRSKKIGTKLLEYIFGYSKDNGYKKLNGLQDRRM
jgi:GNAT superfamily N-acetyltransferase